MDGLKDNAIEAILGQLIKEGPNGVAPAFASLFELAMQIERERFLGAGHYERTDDRRGYANGYKPKRLDTPAGTVTMRVPKSAGHADEPFYPQSLERGQRSARAIMLAVAEMYIKGVSTREVEAVMREFGIESLSSSQVSRAAALLDDELEAWRNRELGEIRYLILDARYEKMRSGGVVILDNLSVHKSAKAEAIVRARGAWMLFLPQYSPDLNPIGMAFSKLKAHLRKAAARTFDALIEAIGNICDLFKPPECHNYFRKAGYASD